MTPHIPSRLYTRLSEIVVENRMKNKTNFPIDFVITWVDQNDDIWKNKMLKYSGQNFDSETDIRYRDYGTLKFVFRSIEKFAPWVNHVFLVTDNQCPKWLNKKNSKISIVNHEEFIDSKYLPTFNSNVIDLNLYKISELSEHFVYFNDDFFLNGVVKPTDFFSENGKPKDTLALNTIMPTGIFDHIYVNNISLINKLFSKEVTNRKLRSKLYNVKNYEWNLLNLLQAPLPRYSRFYDPHVQISFLKSTIRDVLNEHPEVVSVTGKNKFRGATDYSIWLIRYIQMLSGEFEPRSIHFGKHYALNNVSSIVRDINQSKHKLLNINDADGMSDEEFNNATKQIIQAFMNKLNSKCSFELKSVNEG